MRIWQRCALLLLAASQVRTSQAQQIPFKLDVERAVLSNHQRLVATVRIKIDGAEIVRRLGDHDLSMRLRIRDEQGRLYSTEGIMDFRGARKDTHKVNLIYGNDVFVMPGNYNASVRLLDTISGQEGFADHDFRVEPLSGDPLPEMWRDLPPVEFLPGSDGPDGWYIPSMK